MEGPSNFGTLIARFLQQQVNLAQYFEKPIEWLIEQAIEKYVKEKHIVI
jgi:hypothetical protein